MGALVPVELSALILLFDYFDSICLLLFWIT